MEIEYEATFINIDKDLIRGKLKKVQASLAKPEFLQKRIVFDLPNDKDGKKKLGFMRVRDEGGRVTMAYKKVSPEKNIESQKELNVEVGDFDTSVEILKQVGCYRKSYQETKRELWKLDDVEICIDTWPFLESFVEIEGKNEFLVKKVSEKLGFDYSNALFCTASLLYSKKYNLDIDIINNHTPKIVFNMKNPFEL